MTDEMLGIDDLCISFDDFEALHKVSFSMPKGKLIGLIGPNGCGKSTMMKCISKLHTRWTGEIRIDGKSTADMRPVDIAKIVANVPAEMTQMYGMSVMDMVMLGRYPFVNKVWWESEDDEQVVREALQTRPLQEEADIPSVLGREAACADSQGVRAEPQGHACGRTHLPSGHEVQAGGHGVSQEHGPQRYDGHGRRARHIPDGEVLRCLHHHEEGEHSLHGRPQGDHHRGSDPGGLRGRILRRNRSGRGDLRPSQEKREGKPIACAIPSFCWRYPWC